MSASPQAVYTIDDLRRWPEATRDLDKPARLAVFGDPVAHSKSPQLHEPALETCQIDSHYVRLAIKPAELEEALGLCQKHDFIGVNLTIPHKQEALTLLDEIDSHAKELGAVNTVLFEGGQMLGYNTDGPGLVQAVRYEFGMDVRDLRVLIVGAGGGAGRGIAVQCSMEHCQRLVMTNRTLEKAEALLPLLKSRMEDHRVPGPVKRLEVVPFDPDAIQQQLARIDLIINASAIGMKRMDPPALPREILMPHLMVYDTVYAAGGRTKLMQAAEEVGARAANGLSMLLYQGAFAFEIWFNREAPVEAMRRGLLEA